jgi:hypothetical protein
MIKITVPQTKGTAKTYVAGPMTMGLQKALARYGRDALNAAKAAQALEGGDVDINTEEGLEVFNTVMEATTNLTEAQTEIVLRAFGGQISPDDLDNVQVTEITRVIQELQGAAYGVVQKIV